MTESGFEASLPEDHDTEAARCPDCGEVIEWGQTHGHGGTHYSWHGRCQCREWQEHRDHQNKPGFKWWYSRRFACYPGMHTG